MSVASQHTLKISLTESERLLTVTRVFRALFSDIWMTDLIGGAEEPLYVPPASDADRGKIFYRHDYVSSALHEIAHWCPAGVQRRQLVDYGYWYDPDGRDSAQQQRFFSVERKPQALEWIFSTACHLPFRVSMDNLNDLPDSFSEAKFRLNVADQARLWCMSESMPSRAKQFVECLAKEFKSDPLNVAHYSGFGDG